MRCQTLPPGSSYEQDGFAIAPRVAPMSVIAPALASAIDIADGRYASGIAPQRYGGGGGAQLLKIDDAHVADARLRDLATHPSIAAAVRAATGAGPLQVWASQLLVKPPGHGGDGHVGWHQDYHYWRYWNSGSELMTAWIALADVDPDMGPMRFIVASQRWGYRGLGDYFASQEASSAALVAPDGAAAVEHAVILTAGGMSVHHPLTVHGSGDNRSTRTRFSFVLHLRGAAAQPQPGADDNHVDPTRLADPWRCPWLPSPAEAIDRALSRGG